MKETEIILACIFMSCAGRGGRGGWQRPSPRFPSAVHIDYDLCVFIFFGIRLKQISAVFDPKQRPGRG